MPHVLTKDLRLINGVLKVVDEFIPRSGKLIAVGERGSLCTSEGEKDAQRQLRGLGGTEQTAYSGINKDGGAASGNIVNGTSERLSEFPSQPSIKRLSRIKWARLSSAILREPKGELLKNRLSSSGYLQHEQSLLLVCRRLERTLEQPKEPPSEVGEPRVTDVSFLFLYHSEG